MTKSQAIAAGYAIDRTVWPVIAYKGIWYAPTSVVALTAEAEEDNSDDFADINPDLEKEIEEELFDGLSEEIHASQIADELQWSSNDAYHC